jgi:hypothetical protein
MEAVMTLESLAARLTILEQKLITPFKTQIRSQDIGLLLGALAKAQGGYKKLVANEYATGGNFANLEAILEAVKDSLSANGLALYQYIDLLDDGNGAALLLTVLGHESGQTISSIARVFSGKTDRATGNTYEIHKRLHALMILGIAPSKTDPVAFDDNGDQQNEERIVDDIKNPQRQRQLDTNEVLTKARYASLLSELEGYELIAESVMDMYNIETLADLPNEVYNEAIAKIRRIKKTTEEYDKRKKPNE